MSQDLLTWTRVDGRMLIELALPDTLDSAEFDRLNERLLALADQNAQEPWILDLEKSHYFGSAVLGLLVNVRQRIHAAGGTLVLCCLSPYLTQVFQATSLVRLFTIARNREDAMRLTRR